ncbi:MAG: response regulator [Verrucomicrobiales bacterium]|nr:response regulator [Verrucomicrobiales bacterium]
MPDSATEGAPNHILLVDDNLDNLQVLFQALENEGYELLLAQSGEEALRIAREVQPPLVLLDINMPGMDGYETCRQLKADPVTDKANIIFLSAHGSLDDKLTGFEAGAVDFVQKPFQFEEVIARVRIQLAAYYRERSLEKNAASSGEGAFTNLDENRLKEVLAGGEGDSVEFKSTLRHNLHTGKTDKKIENASLKTIAAFLNTSGGFLFVGVDDEGNALGLEPDGFPNQDRFLLHFSNLVHSHLGGEFAPFIRGAIVIVERKEVLAVECLPSPEPVYFRRDQDEVFFVRSGPSTKTLLPSEVVAWVTRK